MREYLPYCVIYVCIVSLVRISSVVLPKLPQYPSVVKRARGRYRLATYQEGRVLSFPTVPEARFTGIAILKGS